MVNVNDLKPGLTISHEGNIYEVIKAEHQKPGKGAAIVKTKLRNLRTGEVKTQSDFCFWYVEEPGEYELEIQNKFRNESRTWYFIIEKNSSFITL